MKLSHFQIYSSTHFILQFLEKFLSVKFAMFLINEKFIAFCDSPQKKMQIYFNPIAFTTAVECRFLKLFSSQSYFASTTAEPQYSMICCSFISQNAKCSQLFSSCCDSRFPFNTVIMTFSWT